MDAGRIRPEGVNCGRGVVDRGDANLVSIGVGEMAYVPQAETIKINRAMKKNNIDDLITLVLVGYCQWFIKPKVLFEPVWFSFHEK
jgi:hypothetical protein